MGKTSFTKNWSRFKQKVCAYVPLSKFYCGMRFSWKQLNISKNDFSEELSKFNF